MGWSEFYGGQGAYSVFVGLSKGLQSAQDNNIKVYMVVLVIWLVVIGVLIYSNSLMRALH